MTRKKDLRRLRIVRDASIPKELRRAHAFAELSKVAKELRMTPSQLLWSLLSTSDK